MGEKKRYKKTIDALENQEDIVDLLVKEFKEAKTEKIFELLKRIPELKTNFHDNELWSETNELISHIKIIERPKTKGELRKQIKKYIEKLKQEKEYTALLFFNELIGLPIGTKIDCMEIIKEDPNEKYLREYVERWKKEKLYRNDSSWIQVKFKTRKIIGASSVLYEKLELPISILSMVTHLDLDTRSIAGAMYSPGRRQILFFEPKKSYNWSKYKKEIFGNYLKTMSDITQKARKTKLEKKILQAIQIFWFSKLSKKTEIRFLMIISAFESLLLTENDRDYLGKKLAEKTAFLLGKDYDEKMELYRLIKKYYGIRSKLVHGSITKISGSDEFTAKNIFMDLIFKLLELTKDYNKMEQKDTNKPQDKEGVEDLINRLKFS